jgi:hypothetical protein
VDGMVQDGGSGGCRRGRGRISSGAGTLDRRNGIARGKRHVCLCVVCAKVRKDQEDEITRIDNPDSQPGTTTTTIRHYQGLLNLAYLHPLTIEFATGSHRSLHLDRVTAWSSDYEHDQAIRSMIFGSVHRGKWYPIALWKLSKLLW